MKSIFTHFILAVIIFSANAQVPLGINYQAVARSSNGAIITNQIVSLKISIIDGSPVGIVQFSEIIAATTNSFGLLNCFIGSGTPVTGTFNAITWSTGNKFIKVEIDPNGGASYVDMGTTKFQSVPFALTANNSNNIAGGSAGQIPYQSAANITSFLGVGSSGQILQSNGNAAPSWVTPTTGTIVVGSISGTSTANGANFSLGVLHLAPADSSNGGIITTTAQTISGAKTFGSDAIIHGLTIGLGGGFQLGNTVIGNRALQSNTNGSQNTAIGNSVLIYNTTGGANTAIGFHTLIANTTGSDNTAVGNKALYSNTTGGRNTAIGYGALFTNITGIENTAVGWDALGTNNNGKGNTAVGLAVLDANTSGSFNTGIGDQALLSNISGTINTATGTAALANNLVGSGNTANGSSSLGQSTGSNNTAIGATSLYNLLIGNNNIGIGNDAQVPSSTANNQVRLGDANITYAGIQVAWTITSDKRWKSEIKNSPLGLDFIKQLTPVSYYRINDSSRKTEFGFIAQEVEKILNNVGAVNTGFISKDDAGMYGVRYNDFIAPMVKAIQELDSINNSQDTLIAAFKKEIQNKNQQISELKNQISDQQNQIKLINDKLNEILNKLNNPQNLKE